MPPIVCVWLVQSGYIAVRRPVQGFMMQLRDHNGMLMPGVEVGEMGPKIDTHKVNVGYARFTHVRIPRFNMFSKLFKVTREGEFIAPPPKLGTSRERAPWLPPDNVAAPCACPASAVFTPGPPRTVCRPTPHRLDL